MADDLGLGSLMTGAAGGFDAITTFFLWLAWMIVIGTGIGILWWYMTFNIKIYIRQQVNGDNYVLRETWARQFKDKATKSFRWRILKPRQYCTPPVDGYLEPFVKGKKLYMAATIDRSIHGDLQWRRPSRNSSIPDSFTAEERSMQVHELREAEAYKKKKFGEIALALAPVMAILMILVIFMLFFNQTVQPSIEMGQSIKGTADALKEATAHMEAVCLNRPTLTSQNNGGVPN